MTKNSKTFAEYYALGAINLQQLLEEISKDENLQEVLEYAIHYAEEYNRWCKARKQREEEMSRDWEWYQQEYFESADEIFALNSIWEDEMYSRDWELAEAEMYGRKYSDLELQAAYDANYIDRKKSIQRIASEAYIKKVPENSIYKFFKDYHLSNAEITVFWLAYYKQSINK